MLLYPDVIQTHWKVIIVFSVLFWTAGLFAALVWMILGQREYIHQYRIVHRLTPTEMPLSDELRADQLQQFPFGLPQGYGDKFEAMFTSQANIQLERMRQHMFVRIGVALFYALSGMILFLIVSSW